MSANFTSVALLILGFAVIYLLIWIFIKPVKFIIKIATNSIVGSLFLVLFNYAGTLLGVSLGVNVYSSLVCGILGVPGFFLLLAGKLFIT